MDSSADVRAALTRSSVLWVAAADGRPHAAWFARATDEEFTCYVIGGAGEQALPELQATTQVILRRRDTRTPVGPLPARVDRVVPGDPRWEFAVAALTAARQGVPTEELLQSWQQDGAVWAIHVEAGEDQTAAG